MFTSSSNLPKLFTETLYRNSLPIKEKLGMAIAKNYSEGIFESQHTLKEGSGMEPETERKKANVALSLLYSQKDHSNFILI